MESGWITCRHYILVSEGQINTGGCTMALTTITECSSEKIHENWPHIYTKILTVYNLQHELLRTLNVYLTIKTFWAWIKLSTIYGVNFNSFIHESHASQDSSDKYNDQNRTMQHILREMLKVRIHIELYIDCYITYNYYHTENTVWARCASPDSVHDITHYSVN